MPHIILCFETNIGLQLTREEWLSEMPGFESMLLPRYIRGIRLPSVSECKKDCLSPFVV